jgi:CrcB protein
MTGFTALIMVALGGAAGAVARFGLTALFQRQAIVLPFGTLAANLLGCLVIGMLAETAARTELLSGNARLLLATGFCGSFTTLSTLTLELVQYLRGGYLLSAAGYFALTFAGAFVSFFAGVALMRLLLRAA